MDNQQAKGGFARAKKLTSKERSEIAQRAADARWNSALPVATHEGVVRIGDVELSCVVLPNGQRIISQSTFLRSLNRNRSARGGQGMLSSADELPYFLQAEALQPFISERLAMSTTPIFYRTKTGGKGIGYDAGLLPKVAEVYMKFGDMAMHQKGTIPKRYQRMVRAADILLRGLSKVGIIALVDEATGYQRDRANDALAKILEAFIAKELRPWVHTFPDEFYEQLFRLRGLSYPDDKVKKPQYFGHLTNDIIYARLAPAVLEELKRMTPRDKKGRYKYQLHRNLTDDIGHPKLREHLASVTTLMKVSNDYPTFHNYLNTIHPKYNENLQLPFSGEESDTGL